MSVKDALVFSLIYAVVQMLVLIIILHFHIL